MSETSYSVAYLGNFRPTHSTENDYLHAWREAGHTVAPYQEGDSSALTRLMLDVLEGGLDLVVWTRTKDLADAVGDEAQTLFLRTCHQAQVPVVGVHLDIWIGLARERQIETDPYFGVDLLLTADGGNQDRWAELGVKHEWLLPGISSQWLGVGVPRDEFRSDIAFVGSWQGGYHREAKHRHELVNWLQRTYGDRVAFWPKRGEHAIRGRDLADLYASTTVVVGDSLVLPGKSHYCSDRIPETLGRGGILLHPLVEGVTGDQPGQFPHCWWDQGDWGMLRKEIDGLLDLTDERHARVRQINVDSIAERHTYTHRVAEIITIMKTKGLL